MVKSYIQDTNDFLRKLKNLSNLPENCILCAIDVIGLYPNIPRDGGLTAVRNALEKRTDQSVSTDSLVELTECVLKNNYFEHNSRVFRQLKGTAIGTKMAPSYSILFMGELEENILEKCELKPFIWWRYIDDIFMIWEHGEEKLKEFLSFLNNCHPSIKFTYEYSYEKINFLDVTVLKHNNKLLTDLYVKPTDTHQYLEASSCHVYHVKKSVPYSQALRLNRICSENIFFDRRCNQLEQWLHERGYNKKLVRKEILKARKFSRNDLLDKETQNKSNSVLTLNVTYHPAYAKIKRILKEIHLLLTPDKEHQKVFSSIPIVGFKRGKSLKDYLVKAKVPTLEKTGTSKPCNKTRCQVCKFVKSSEEFGNTDKSQVFRIRCESLNCDSKFVVYMIQCKTCKKQYIGSTSTPFRLRFNNYKAFYKKHLEGIMVPQETFFNHFDQFDHNSIEDWEITLIDKADNIQTLRQKESFWQYKLNSFSPHGLNECEVPLA